MMRRRDLLYSAVAHNAMTISELAKKSRFLTNLCVKASGFLDRTVLKNKPRVFKIGNAPLSFPRDHLLPVILKKHPEYSQNLVRLAKAVSGKYSSLKIIDVGGNVGDTVAFLRIACDSPVASFEGDKKFFPFLQKNAGLFKNVFLFEMFLGESEGYLDADLENAGGTMKISGAADGGKKIKISTLDKFVQKNPGWSKAKFLKIDTDGFDFKILRGASDFLKTAKPALFFEYARNQFESSGEKGLDALEFLSRLGYQKIIFYDNFGRFLLSSDLSDTKLISELHYYTRGKSYGRTFPYYDVAVFHKEDADLSDAVSEIELQENMKD